MHQKGVCLQLTCSHLSPDEPLLLEVDLGVGLEERPVVLLEEFLRAAMKMVMVVRRRLLSPNFGLFSPGSKKRQSPSAAAAPSTNCG